MVEKRQSRIYKNREDHHRWLKRMFRAATELKRIDAEYRRLLRGPSKKGYTPMEPTGIGGGAVDGLNDELPGEF